MKIQNQGFDHVEFVVRDIAKYGVLFSRLGFELAGQRHLPERGIKSACWSQGLVRIVLTQPDGSAAGEHQDSVKFLRQQDEGVCVLGVDVDDATQAFHEAVKRGARPAMEPKRFESAQGSLVRSEIWTLGNIRYAFMERVARNGVHGPALLDEGLTVARLESPSPMGVWQIDHLTNNVSIGEMPRWAEWYQRILDFEVVRHFDISTGRTGLTSDVVQSKCGRIKVPINQANEPTSQVQEFVDRLKGPGVQHLAFLTTGIMQTVAALKEQGFKFLSVPHSYYEVVPTRVPGVTENIGALEELGVLLDGEGGGYLMQIFSEEQMGPFFFEFIQRKGNQGFGEGNFRALFEAIERDQIQRGVLKA